MLTACALVLSLANTASAAVTLDAVPARDDITVDGRLDELSWQTAGRINDLVQQDPRPGEPTAYTTEVMVLADPGGLTFGFICRDPEPGRIAVHTMQRDGALHGDDSIALVLDPFGDQRRGYYFRINAAGARVDGLISGPEQMSLDWDGIWYAATEVTDEGWTAEIRIPAQTLRYPGRESAWGLNIERVVARERLTLRWADSSLDAGLFDLRRAGLVTGTGILDQGLGLSISPYGAVRTERDEGASSYTATGDVGGDATWNVTPELSAVLTVNTDFAETEVDTRQINLTRFPLFFPEKRAFFLEGSEQFTFGSGLGYDFIPYFSRRIGLYAGEQVPIEAGAKLLGRSGRWGIGVLGTRTGSTEHTAEANLFVGRITYDVDRHLTVGTILTDGHPDGVAANTLGGVDAVWQTSTLAGDRNFSVGAWAAASRGDVPAGQRGGWGLKVDYPNDLWDLYAVYREFGEGLDPALGFMPRPGTRWLMGGGSYQPRPGPGAFDWVRQFFFEFYPLVVYDLEGRTESWRVFTAPFNARTESGEHLEANYMPRYERLTEPFEVADGVVIPAGEYRFDRFRFEAESSEHRPVSIGATVWFGDFFTGSLTQWESFVNYASGGGHLQLRLGVEQNFGDLPEGTFTQRLYQLRAVYAFSPDLILSSYTQYDSESRNVGLNNRLRWTLQPGNDLFLVWSRNFLRPVDPDEW
ncbi:hypothetical protein DRQ50_14160, partial [bacterium]